MRSPRPANITNRPADIQSAIWNLELTSTATRRFHKLCLATLVAVYFLILVGGVVRATGSGMGCPDWPTCFGSWIPPTSVEQLPPDYKVQNAAYREKKNQKFARFLTSIGMSETADRLLNDPNVLQEEDFNATKTWVEYINRLVGVTIGLMIMLVARRAWLFRREHLGLFRGAALLLILVSVQGWFGSIVVSTNLTSRTITVHMFLAIVMVALLVWLIVRSDEAHQPLPRSLRVWALAALAVFLTQVFLGTE